MIKVLLVEDEPPVMRMLEKLLETHTGGKSFEVVGRAFNGKRALEILETENIDIDVVFADIKMPVMGGIELSGEIQKRYPHIYTVLVSGYQDFNYARRAIQFGVFDYLLKPLSRETFGVLLDKLEVTVNIHKKERKHEKLLRAINDDLPEQNNMVAEDCTLILICAGAFPLSQDDSMLPSRTFWDNTNLELIISEISGNTLNVMIFNGKTTSEKVVVVENGSDELVKSLYSRLNLQKSLAVTLIISGYPIGINGVSEALRSLRARLYSEIRLCSPRLIFANEPPPDKKGLADASRLSENIISAIGEDDRDSLAKCLNETFEKLGEAGITQLETVSFLKGIASKVIYASDPFDRTLSAVNFEIEDAISNTSDFESLARDISSILHGVKDNALKNDKTPVLIQNIEEYLQKNYTQTITNSVLSNEFGFVPSYISRLFKSYKGVSPGDYLTNYRINKAKQLMKENPDLMVKELASLVGINDQYYFSKLFKKETGKSPTEY